MLGRNAGQIFFSGAITLVVIASALIAQPKILGWYLLPVSLCGIVTIFNFLRSTQSTGRWGVESLANALAIHLFFLAPILHQYWQFFMPFVVPPDDWAHWFGYMAALNLLGLAAYEVGKLLGARRRLRKRAVVTFDYPIFYNTGIGICLVAALCQTYVYVQFGGIAGYLAAFTYEPDLFSGWGWIFAISEAFPIVFGALVVTSWKLSGARVANIWLVLFVIGLVVLIAFFGGLKGSRNHYVWEIVWVVGLFAIWIRPITKPLLAGGMILMMFFMMGYSFFKEYGSNVDALIENPALAANSWRYDGRVFEGVVLGDFSRSDVQAYVLYRLAQSDGDYELAAGRTYLAAFSQVVPQALIGERPHSKTYFGTSLLYGRAAADGGFVASNIYGLGGEAMLNFGILGIPLAYLAFGILLRGIGSYFESLQEGDARWIFFPFVLTIGGWALVSDFDNVLVFLFKYGLIPFAWYFVSTRRSALHARMAVGS
jgi:hypothetical protein